MKLAFASARISTKQVVPVEVKGSFMAFIPAHSALVGFQPGDDIDVLFDRLPQIEPSGEVVTRLLAHIQRIPGPLWQQETLAKPEAGLGHVDISVVRSERRDPS
jgi:hypothetical protein